MPLMVRGPPMAPMTLNTFGIALPAKRLSPALAERISGLFLLIFGAASP
ncbi:hypothetical protein SAMN05216567_109203 [Variovorax sp. OK605]|nr:hypothetical protein SAMN05216567_109203 [Variovorax sp. OK605]